MHAGLRLLKFQTGIMGNKVVTTLVLQEKSGEHVGFRDISPNDGE